MQMHVVVSSQGAKAADVSQELVAIRAPLAEAEADANPVVQAALAAQSTDADRPHMQALIYARAREVGIAEFAHKPLLQL